MSVHHVIFTCSWPVCLQKVVRPVYLQTLQLHLQVKPLQRCTTPQKRCALEALSSLACPQTGLPQSLTWLSPQPCHHPLHIKPAHLDPPQSPVIDPLNPRTLSRILRQTQIQNRLKLLRLMLRLFQQKRQ